jgi:hypothetical protein
MSWYWNEIGDKDSAKYATTTAVWVSYLIALGNGLMGVFVLVQHSPMVRLSSWDFFKCGSFCGSRLADRSPVSLLGGHRFFALPSGSFDLDWNW